MGFFLGGTQRRIHGIDEHHQSSVRPEHVRLSDPAAEGLSYVRGRVALSWCLRHFSTFNEA